MFFKKKLEIKELASRMGMRTGQFLWNAIAENIEEANSKEIDLRVAERLWTMSNEELERITQNYYEKYLRRTAQILEI